MIKKIAAIWKHLWNFMNGIFPKLNQVLIIGNDSIESNAIVLANYINRNYKLKVYLSVSKGLQSEIHNIVDKEVKIINYKGPSKIIILCFTKYIFSTHDIHVKPLKKRQIYTNVWHGAAYKNIRIARGEAGIPANITLATSELVKEMFAKFFGVMLDSVFVSGYPRNDAMLEMSNNKEKHKEQYLSEFSQYDKIIIWMPTFRRSGDRQKGNDKIMLGNEFNILDFDIAKFNEILKQNNTLCLLKTHYFYKENTDGINHSNIVKIDDNWLLERKLNLYQLLGLTDILISDFSSVIMDYTLLDNPVICFSKDLEEYKKNQGLCFEDIENWIPSPLFSSNFDFFNHLEHLLKGFSDPFIVRRHKVRNVFFKYHDAKGAERLVKYVFDKNK